jgi:hypothetical protein
MAKKDISSIEKGAGYFLGFITTLMNVARQKVVPFEAIYRLGTEGGYATLVKIVDIAYTDWLEERPLADGEYRVPVAYDMPRDKGKLEAEFSKNGVSELFYGNYEWKNHPSCAEIDQTPGERVMLVKHFDRRIKSEDAIAEMDKRGYRPATHLEAYAFAKANTELRHLFWIVALGSSAMRGDERGVAVLDGDSSGRVVDRIWFFRGWSSDNRFLFVRK